MPARGVVDALRERGVSVPEDIAVVGLDNWDVIAGATRPPLTTIDMTLHELRWRASRRMSAMINDATTQDEAIGLSCWLLVRQSCDASFAGFAHWAAADVTGRAAQ
jgi:LacI family transcriptional regulator